MPLYEVIAADDADVRWAEGVLATSGLRRLVARNPTHMDCHQYFHLREPVSSVMIEHAGVLGVPLRHMSSAICCCGNFYGQASEGMPLADAINVEAMLAILAGLPEGITELACHSGQADDFETMYRSKRALELSTLLQSAGAKGHRLDEHATVFFCGVTDGSTGAVTAGDGGRAPQMD